MDGLTAPARRLLELAKISYDAADDLNEDGQVADAVLAVTEAGHNLVAVVDALLTGLEQLAGTDLTQH